MAATNSEHVTLGSLGYHVEISSRLWNSLVRELKRITTRKQCTEEKCPASQHSFMRKVFLQCLQMTSFWIVNLFPDL